MQPAGQDPVFGCCICRGATPPFCSNDLSHLPVTRLNVSVVSRTLEHCASVLCVVLYYITSLAWRHIALRHWVSYVSGLCACAR